MRLIILLAGIFIVIHPGYSRSLLLKEDSTFSLNMVLTRADTDKYCLLINCFSKSDRIIEDKLVRPLILIKCFLGDISNYQTEISSENITSAMLLSLYSELVVLPNLVKDLTLNLQSFQREEEVISDEFIDTLIVFKNNKYYRIGGLILSEFYNVVPFRQKSVFQANSTLINTLSIIPGSLFRGAFTNVADKTAPFLLNGKLVSTGRILLLQRLGNNTYKFCKIPDDVVDDPHIFYLEFIFNPKTGITGFYSKYIELTSYLTSSGGKVITSDKYYNFLPMGK